MTSLVPDPGADERLRDIQAITDAAMAHLEDDEAFLAALLDRTRAVLRADTAAVLLLDPAGEQLVATAAAGLEEEVRQGVRIPVGRGFAGRIAAQGGAVILDHVDSSNVLNPILVDKGIHSLMGVPLTVRGKVLGVLHVGTLTSRRFTAEDGELLQLAADRAAIAVESMLARADRAAAGALQRSLVPSANPSVAGAEIAARYVPGSGVVGGDWYDVFTLPSGEVGVVIGDVAGSGLPAAVIMGRMRSALRAYALQSRSPAKVLRNLDRKMQHFEPGALATVLYAVFHPRFTSVRISSAGHLPPIMAVPGRRAVQVGIVNDLMIGVDLAVERQVTTLKIRPGTLLCCYTDGLVERPDRPLDEGLDWLTRVIRAEPPERACARVMGALIGGESARDDIALLMIRTPVNPVMTGNGTRVRAGMRTHGAHQPRAASGG
jgi:serine phosphatase RsbU (regulator of sigma subunit)